MYGAILICNRRPFSLFAFEQPCDSAAAAAAAAAAATALRPSMRDI